MDTQKIVNKDRNGYQRLDFQIADDAVILIANSVERFGRFKGRERRKYYFRTTIRMRSADIILHVLHLARHGIVHVAVQNFVHLQNVIPRNRNHVEIFVYDVQNITVARNFLLVTVSRRSLFGNQLSDPRTCGNNPLDRVGRLSTLHFCNLHQFFKFAGALLQIKFLLAGLLINSRNQTENFRIPLLLFQF